MQPDCPHLPAAAAELDWRVLHACGTQRGGVFYLRCLEYAQNLWRRGLAARAILCLDRALFADLQGAEAELALHPLPYPALAWILRQTPAGVFLGNPRVHYQHLAARLRGPRAVLKSTRAWACWHIVRQAKPDLPADPRHTVHEPSFSEIEALLAAGGLPGEKEHWRRACALAGGASPAA